MTERANGIRTFALPTGRMSVGHSTVVRQSGENPVFLSAKSGDVVIVWDCARKVWNQSISTGIDLADRGLFSNLTSLESPLDILNEDINQLSESEFIFFVRSGALKEIGIDLWSDPKGSLWRSRLSGPEVLLLSLSVVNP